MNFKYTEIMNFVKGEIAKGNYKSKLPSIRGLAIRFSCSNSTVIKAYGELAAEGIIYAAPKSGYFINQSRPDQGKEVDFYSGIPLSSDLPFDSMEKAYASSFRENNMSIMNYSYSRGFDKLRQLLADSFPFPVSMDNVFILSGTQNFINLIVAMTTRNQQDILVENPTYNLLLGALNAYGRKTRYIDRSLDGLDLDALEQKAAAGTFRYFFTMTRNHNPLGTSLSPAQRKRLLELAEKYDFYIVEDDYLKELSGEDCLFHENPQRVIYVRSFSKTISPSLRLCAMTVPDALLAEVQSTNIYMNTGASLISQDVLYRYLTGDSYHKNSEILRQRIEEKCLLMKESLQDCPFPWHVPDVGLYAYIELPKGFRTMELLDNMDAKGMRFRSDVEFSVDREARGLRISLSRVDTASIARGIGALLEELESLRALKPVPKEIYL